MPSPAFALKGKKTDRGVTNVRNTQSPHWRRWLGVEHRCVVPFTSFAEPWNRQGMPSENVWFAVGEDEPIGFFAGIWTQWTSVRKLKDGETTDNLFGFLTTEANAEVAKVHPKAMPVVLTDLADANAWLSSNSNDALALQRPLMRQARRYRIFRVYLVTVFVIAS
ncbi:SOS response-associated peptidase family protein [Yoonia sp. GPGPB17]|uniref:SOS response-associated peptidase family protein n=1 Tax=Yoonia sp. GPGPB17 TaxID=3026147 RepID=UPI0030BE6156